MSSAVVASSMARFFDLESTKCCASGPTMVATRHFIHHHKQSSTWCSMSMNGCRSDPQSPIGVAETRTFPSAASTSLAVDRLSSAIAALKAHPPDFSSGIIRLQVPIEEKIEAIDWLHSQNSLLPRCFFSSRSALSISDHLLQSTKWNGSSNGNGRTSLGHKLVSVAGMGSAVFFRHLQPFSYGDWMSIKRFLCIDCPLIRAYGAIRFDPRSNVSPEWESFGSFYFVVPQVEFDELEESSILATTIAWDDALSWSLEEAIDALEEVMQQMSSLILPSNRKAPKVILLSNNHLPTEKHWDLAVRRALQMISGNNSALTKVVLARSTKFVAANLDPMTWLACLQAEGEGAYQFLLQPPNAPAFIGNTPEQLFHRKCLSIQSEALAGTRARGATTALDLQIEQDLQSSPKDHLEFTIVRESIRRRLETVCSRVVVEPEKAIRKLPRVQHLHALLAGRLRTEDDEFEILSSLHPSPAVCGFPTEEARRFIAETEIFDRGMYAGPVGWFGGGESEFAVGIRSALVDKGLGAQVYAGTGIVEGSNPSLEWEELEIKTSQFTKLLKLEVGSERELLIHARPTT